MDYCEIAIESLLNENVLMRNATINRLLAESEFIQTSMKNGFIGEYVQEASLKETGRKILDALREFLDKITSMFRKKTVEKYKQYIDWVKENTDKIKEKAADASITIAPYWNGSQKDGETAIKTLIADAFKYPYKDDDLSFAKSLLSYINSKDDLNDTKKITAILKNKFRFGQEEEDNSKIKKETLEKNDLVSKVDGMISYCVDYEKIGQGLTNLSNTWKSQAENFQKAMESYDVLSKDMFLLIENTTLSHTDLRLLEGYDELPDVLFEEGNNSNNNSNNDNKSSGDNKPSSGNGNSGGDNKSGSLTDVQNNNKEDGDNKSPSSNDRYKMVDKFVRIAFSAYMTACEERFIVYVKLISQVLGESPVANKKKK